MDLARIIEMVDKERLYAHVRALEGIKHPLDSYKALIQGAEYIEKTFRDYGLDVTKHHFKVKGMDKEFFNIEAYLNKNLFKPEKPIYIITGHFDTVYNTPGADDNASAVAIQLEIARILKEKQPDLNIIFVVFNLEEGSPFLQKTMREKAIKYGLMDESYRYLSYHSQRVGMAFREYFFKTRGSKGYLNDTELEDFLSTTQSTFTQQERTYYKEINELHKEYPEIFHVALIGSKVYADKVIQEKWNIQGVLNLETIGFTSKKAHSQHFPPGMTLDMFPTHNVNSEEMIGNFVAIIGDEYSEKLATSFFEATKEELVDLPSVNIAVPLDYNAIKENLPDLLRSDHAPFWYYKIPALMLTDTANFRNPYYHTGGDTIETLDFEFMQKVCQAVLITVLKLHS